MKLEASPVGESVVKMNQIQAQLANVMLQLQDIKKAKEYRDDIWCTRCHEEDIPRTPVRRFRIICYQEP